MILRTLWAKAPSDGRLYYLPLSAHLSDTAETARRLWKEWVPEHIQNQLCYQLFLFLCYIHDLGKGIPAFQGKELRLCNRELQDWLRKTLIDAGFLLEHSHRDAKKTPHALATHLILQRKGVHESVCVVLSGHHGKPPSTQQIMDALCFKKNFKKSRKTRETLWIYQTISK